jgi:hypothetical protein
MRGSGWENQVATKYSTIHFKCSMGFVTSPELIRQPETVQFSRKINLDLKIAGCF